MCRPPGASYNNGMHTAERPITEAVPSGPRWAVGGRFVDALGQRDFDGMARCLDRSVQFRGLLPSGPFDVVGPEAAMVRFRQWFGGPDLCEMIDATVGEVGSKLYLRWRVAMTPASSGAPVRVAEQHLFATIDQRIVGLDLLCSGFSVRSADRAC